MIAAWPVKSDNLCPRVSIAILKMLAKKPALKCSPADVKKLGEMDELPMIDRLLKKARECMAEEQGGCYRQHRTLGGFKGWF